MFGPLLAEKGFSFIEPSLPELPRSRAAGRLAINCTETMVCVCVCVLEQGFLLSFNSLLSLNSVIHIIFFLPFFHQAIMWWPRVDPDSEKLGNLTLLTLTPKAEVKVTTSLCIRAPQHVLDAWFSYSDENTVCEPCFFILFFFLLLLLSLLRALQPVLFIVFFFIAIVIAINIPRLRSCLRFNRRQTRLGRAVCASRSTAWEHR